MTSNIFSSECLVYNYFERTAHVLPRLFQDWLKLFAFYLIIL